MSQYPNCLGILVYCPTVQFFAEVHTGAHHAALHYQMEKSGLIKDYEIHVTAAIVDCNPCFFGIVIVADVPVSIKATSICNQSLKGLQFYNKTTPISWGRGRIGWSGRFQTGMC